MLQGLEAVKELPVMLLVMMLAFFKADPPCSSSTHNTTSKTGAGGSSSSPNSRSISNGQSKKPRMVLQQPEKVMRIHDYYMHKLQVTTPKFWIERLFK